MICNIYILYNYITIINQSCVVCNIIYIYVIPPGYLTQLWKMTHLQMIFPARNLHLQWIFHGYVIFFSLSIYSGCSIFHPFFYSGFANDFSLLTNTPSTPPRDFPELAKSSQLQSSKNDLVGQCTVADQEGRLNLKKRLKKEENS